jgi:hypothetical protein
MYGERAYYRNERSALEETLNAPALITILIVDDSESNL